MNVLILIDIFISRILRNPKVYFMTKLLTLNGGIVF